MRTKIHGVVFLLVGLIALLLPCAALAQISDQTLAERAMTSIHKYGRLTMFDDVTVTVKNRAVTLTGKVTQPYKKDEVGARVAAIDGIRTLVNEIGVLPALDTDAALRQRLASSIYGHPAFWRFKEMREPPIHIIVEYARVTLTGYVLDQGDKTLAAALAQVNGVMSVKNELRIERQ
jgi:osmotically-inducible protein OsmY